MSQPAAHAPRGLAVGDPAPWVRQRTSANPNYALDTVGGRYVVLCFYGSAGHQRGRAAVDHIRRIRKLFDDQRLTCFGVSLDPRDESEARVGDDLPGIRFFWDFDGSMSRRFGVLASTVERGTGVLHARWLVLDPTLRVRAVLPFRDDLGDHAELSALLQALPPVDRHVGFEVQAPVLVIPHVFDAGLCRALVSYYESKGGFDSGFMREIGGRTVGAVDYSYKRREDCEITDPGLLAAVQSAVGRRVHPEIRKVHFFDANRMERYIVSCYAAEQGAHFAAHRDNTTTGTAHRRYALSVNLNDDFDGGEVSFPEYGPRGFKAPAGGAVVFSCSLMHQVSRVTRGRRYAFLPFLYDDAAAKQRETNDSALDKRLQGYRAAAPAGSSAA